MTFIDIVFFLNNPSVYILNMYLRGKESWISRYKSVVFVCKRRTFIL